MKTKTLCIYHSPCPDGFAAAWVVRQALGADVSFLPGAYSEPPPDVSGLNVVLVDFSYKRPVMEALIEAAEHVIILDHHKSAIEDLGDLLADERMYGTLDASRSGCMLAFEWYFPDLAPPRLLKHIEDRDLWKFQLDGTREIMAALFSYPYGFKTWDDLMHRHGICDELRSDGRSILRAHDKNVREWIAHTAHRITIGEHEVPAVNAPHFMASDACHILAHGEPFAAAYWDTEKHRHFSLRSESKGLDVAAIAQLYGGGGHEHAAGFRIPIDQIRWTLAPADPHPTHEKEAP